MKSALCEQTMEKQMLEDIKELFQAFIAPQLEGIKGDIRALDTKITALDTKVDTKISALDTKIDTKIAALDMKIDTKIDSLDTKIDSLDTKIESYRRELLAEMRGMDQMIQRVEKTLSTDFARLEQKVDLRLGSMDEKLDLFRREMLAEIKAASK